MLPWRHCGTPSGSRFAFCSYICLYVEKKKKKCKVLKGLTVITFLYLTYLTLEVLDLASVGGAVAQEALKRVNGPFSKEQTRSCCFALRVMLPLHTTISRRRCKTLTRIPFTLGKVALQRKGMCEAAARGLPLSCGSPSRPGRMGSSRASSSSACCAISARAFRPGRRSEDG